MRGDNLAGAMQAHDFRWTREGAEHENDAAILSEMSRCLNATAGQIKVRDLFGADDPECVHSLGRAIDQAILRKRRSGHEEKSLLPQPLR
jgi:hypothetical protein